MYGVESKKISYVGEETLATPLGVERVIHLRSETSAAVEDIWIAPGRRNMPVKFTIPAGRQVLIATVTKLEFR